MIYNDYLWYIIYHSGFETCVGTWCWEYLKRHRTSALVLEHVSKPNTLFANHWFWQSGLDRCRIDHRTKRNLISRHQIDGLQVKPRLQRFLKHFTSLGLVLKHVPAFQHMFQNLSTNRYRFSVNLVPIVTQRLGLKIYPGRFMTPPSTQSSRPNTYSCLFDNHELCRVWSEWYLCINTFTFIFHWYSDVYSGLGTLYDRISIFGQPLQTDDICISVVEVLVILIVDGTP